MSTVATVDFLRTLTEAERTMRLNLWQVRFKEYWLPGRPDRRYRSPLRVVLCHREHLAPPQSPDNDGGFEIALMGPSGYQPLLGSFDRMMWLWLTEQCVRESLELSSWMPTDAPDNLLSAFVICNPDQVRHWPSSASQRG